MNDAEKKVEDCEVGERGEFVLYGTDLKREVRARPFRLVSTDVSLSGDTVTFRVDDKVFRGYLRQVSCVVNAKRIK